MPIVSLISKKPLGGTNISRSVSAQNVLVNIDATISENFSAPMELTQHPVEKDADISDHVILRPQILKIEGVMSAVKLRGDEGNLNQLAGLASSVAASVGQSLGGAIGAIGGGVAAAALFAQTQGGLLENTDYKQLEAVIEEFLSLSRSKQTVNIVTGLKSYNNFILTDFTVNRNQQSGLSFNVSLEFRQLLTVEAQSKKVEIPEEAKSLGKSNEGRKDKIPQTPEQEKSSSAAFQILSAIRS